MCRNFCYFFCEFNMYKLLLEVFMEIMHVNNGRRASSFQKYTPTWAIYQNVLWGKHVFELLIEQNVITGP